MARYATVVWTEAGMQPGAGFEELGPAKREARRHITRGALRVDIFDNERGKIAVTIERKGTKVRKERASAARGGFEKARGGRSLKATEASMWAERLLKKRGL